jgi:hypothetical protein
VGDDNQRQALRRRNTEIEGVAVLLYLKKNRKLGKYLFSEIFYLLLYALSISSAKWLSLWTVSCHTCVCARVFYRDEALLLNRIRLNSLPLLIRMRLIPQQDVCVLLQRSREREREREVYGEK